MIKEISTSLDSFEIYTLFKDDKYSFILDSAMDEENLGRYSFVSSNPFKVLKYKDSQINPLEELRIELDKYKIKNNTGLPFIGGAVGYLSYDLGNYIEKLPRSVVDDIKSPDLYFGFYDWVIVVDHLMNKTFIATPDINVRNEKDVVDNVCNLIKDAQSNGVDKLCYEQKEFPKVKLESNFKKKDYIDAIEKIRNYIKNGDIYQANMTQRFHGKISMSSFELYRDLRKISPAPFGAFLNFEDVHILSNSPERFIKVSDNYIQTRPIKGTRPRGSNEEDDLLLKNELLNSEKDKAELLMIVDLERNDIGRVSKIGTVKVPELFKLEEYANVHHLVSTVVGEIENDKDIIDVISATFPGGSITGAPKIRAMQIIDELEPTARNIYTGSIGYIGFDSNADFNISIRTIIKKDDDVFFQVGGGITWDSNPEDEYEETLHKAKSIMNAIRGHYEE
ncbi:aminodeoxychorismate synthase component I [Tepidibacter mesophilus]|uniref:aminodeoxychorismate synthase component I n=1 Tax=Tepidibacter mesophilus TaxID=655607 RepID=UPI000C08C973|nr:aminodeoxychorismate synthase component I [Tepidibacter mesophilus]